MSLEVSFSYFLEELEKDGINSWLVEFAMKLSGLRVLSVERVLIVDSISGLFRFSVFSWFSHDASFFCRNFPFHLDLWFHFPLFLQMEALSNWTSRIHTLLRNQGCSTFLVNPKCSQISTKMTPVKHQLLVNNEGRNEKNECKKGI